MKKAENFTNKMFYDPKDSGICYAISCIAPQLLATLVYYILLLSGVDNNIVKLFISCLAGPICYFTFFFTYNSNKKIAWKQANSFSFKTKWWHPLLAIGFGLICLFGLNNFVSLCDYGLEIIGYKASGIEIPLSNAGWFILSVFLFAVIPAIGEELMFRGVIFNGIKEMGETKAVFFSAFLFALFHGNASQTIYQFLLGIVLAYTVVITKNIFCSMIMHFTNNFVVLLINYINRNAAETSSFVDARFIALSITGLVATVLFVFIVVYVYKAFTKKEQTDVEIAQQTILERKVTKDVFSNVLLWIGIAFALTIWILDFIY